MREHIWDVRERRYACRREFSIDPNYVCLPISSYARVFVCLLLILLPRARLHVLDVRQLEKNGGIAKDYYDLYGPEARASIELADKAVRWIDLQELVLWVLAQNSVMKPSWIFVNNKVR